MTERKLLVGDILLINNTDKSAWFSNAQHIISGKPYTHTAVGIGEIAGFDSIIEADMVVTCRPFRTLYLNTQYEWEQWRFITNFPTRLDSILSELYNHFAESEYGFSQIVWFLYIALMKKLKKDARKSRNPFSPGTICTELVWWYLHNISIRYAYIGLNALNDKLAEWNPNNLFAGDIADIVHKFEGSLFVKVDEFKKS
jgi:hypothetical protein